MAKVLIFPEHSKEVTIEPTNRQSYSFARSIFSRSTAWAATGFGLASLVCLLAFLVNIPILQIAVLGYFLDSSAKIARGGNLSTGFIGLKTASKIGRWVLCTSIVLIPLRVVGGLWANAQIIDSTSQQTAGLSTLYSTLAVLTTVHVLSALSCGGTIGHFFWPLVLPFSVLTQICKRIARVSRRVLGRNKSVEASPRSDSSPTDWFVPKIVWRKIRQGTLYSRAREDTLNFLRRLQLPHFVWLGLRGFLGSVIWLLLPTVLLANANHPRAEFAGLCVALGVLIAAPVFMILPMLQIQFAVDGRLGSLFDVRSAWARTRRAPLACLFALLLLLVLTLPLFLLKIEKIPPELFWLLSVLFVVLGWPARFAWGWAYRYAQPRENRAARSIRWPIGILTAALALVFAFIFFLTRYTSWNGTRSLFENHVFLLPAPFWF